LNQVLILGLKDQRGRTMLFLLDPAVITVSAVSLLLPVIPGCNSQRSCGNRRPVSGIPDPG
jgi:hypothetical protein